MDATIYDCETLAEAQEIISHWRIEYEQNGNEVGLSEEEFIVYILAYINRQDLLNKCRWVTIERLIKDGHLREDKYGVFAIVPDEATEAG